LQENINICEIIYQNYFINTKLKYRIKKSQLYEKKDIAKLLSSLSWILELNSKDKSTIKILYILKKKLMNKYHKINVFVNIYKYILIITIKLL